MTWCTKRVWIYSKFNILPNICSVSSHQWYGRSVPSVPCTWSTKHVPDWRGRYLCTRPCLHRRPPPPFCIGSCSACSSTTVIGTAEALPSSSRWDLCCEKIPPTALGGGVHLQRRLHLFHGECRRLKGVGQIETVCRISIRKKNVSAQRKDFARRKGNILSSVHGNAKWHGVLLDLTL